MGDHHQNYNCNNNAIFVNRRDTLHKKLYEFCTLCDVKACMINFGPDNEIGTWPSDREKVNAFIQEYKSAVEENLCKEKLLLSKENQKQSSSSSSGYSSKNSSLLSYYEEEKASLQLKVNETRMARFNKMSSAWSSSSSSNNNISKNDLGLPIESLRKSAATFDSKLALLEEKLGMLLMSNTTTNRHQITTTTTHIGKRKRVDSNTSRLQQPPQQQQQPPPQQQQQEPPQQQPPQQLQLLLPQQLQQQQLPLPQQLQQLLQQHPPLNVSGVELGFNPMIQYAQTPMLTTQLNCNCNCNCSRALAALMAQWSHYNSNGTTGPPTTTFRPHQPIPIMWMWPQFNCYPPPPAAAAAPPPPQGPGPVDKPPNQS